MNNIFNGIEVLEEKIDSETRMRLTGLFFWEEILCMVIFLKEEQEFWYVLKDDYDYLEIFIVIDKKPIEFFSKKRRIKYNWDETNDNKN